MQSAYTCTSGYTIYNTYIGASLSEPHTSESNGGIFIIMANGSTPYVGIMGTPYVRMTPKKMAATLTVHKWHARNVCFTLVNSLNEPYQAVSSASMANNTINFAGKYC